MTTVRKELLMIEMASKNPFDLLPSLFMTVMKASVLSAHDKGSHAEVRVKVRKVIRSGRVALHLGTASVFPLPWTHRGCTCPVLNPGKHVAKTVMDQASVKSISNLCFLKRSPKRFYFYTVSPFRCEILACWPRGAGNGSFVGHHAERSGSVDASTSFAFIRGAEERMSTIQTGRAKFRGHNLT